MKCKHLTWVTQYATDTSKFLSRVTTSKSTANNQVVVTRKCTIAVSNRDIIINNHNNNNNNNNNSEPHIQLFTLHLIWHNSQLAVNTMTMSYQHTTKLCWLLVKVSQTLDLKCYFDYSNNYFPYIYFHCRPSITYVVRMNNNNKYNIFTDATLATNVSYLIRACYYFT